ncbi:hypothetical protein HKX48_000455, partial [Thoreauomyces humboldtii]
MSATGSPPPLAPDGTSASPAGKTRKTRVQACDRCRTRKRKCNGAHPVCSNCENARARGQPDTVCHYAEKKKRPRKQRRDVLLGRLEALEALLKPLQESGEGVAANTAAATRAEIAGIMQGLVAADALKNKTRGAAEGNQEDDMVPDGDADGDGSDSEHSHDEDMEEDDPADQAFPGQQQWPYSPDPAAYNESTTHSRRESSSSAAMMSDALGSDDDQALSFEAYSASPATSMTAMDTSSELPLFDAISWPAVAPPRRNDMRGSPDLTYSLDPSLLQQRQPPTMTATNAITGSPLLAPSKPVHPDSPHLFTHLIHLYFTNINPCMPVLDEFSFFGDLVPINRHPPALLYAIYAYGAPHSRHPELFAEPYRDPLSASRLFHAEATKALNGISNVIIRMQVLVMLGKWSVGMNQPARAYQYLSSAIQASERARLGFLRGHEKQRLLALWGPAPVDNPRHTLRTIRLTWGLCFTSDTYISMAADVSPTIEESNYVHLLAESVEISRAIAEDPELGPRLDAGGGEWRHIIEGHPSCSIHDFRPIAWSPDPESLESTCSRTKPWFTQLQFILRRITRFTRSVPFNAHRYDGTPAGVIFSVLPNTGGANLQHREHERLRLHTVLVDWWNTLPADERAFEDLAVFRHTPASPSSPAGTPSIPPSPPLPSVAQLASFQFVMMNSFFIAAFAILHHRDGADLDLPVGGGGFGYPASSSPTAPLATSREVLTLALRAQCFLIRSVYAMHGFASIPAGPPPPPPPPSGSSSSGSSSSYVGFSTTYPPPPMILVQNPMTLYAVWCVAEAALIDLSRTPMAHPERAETQREMFEVVSQVFLPMLESSERVWTVMRVYKDRLRDAAARIVRGVE